ncbi:ArsR/SmtB family transcription factor [Clostridium manihotivorum]|uniref:Transcriptional regulator n=1 Tax=Clostridium manihotivorum TaxID=2320868 RepID=A0A3R5QUG2_9CLOT|nr:metalloregulator ArsR/SmtB family transcription factor [Clostridium manihotivorum]QAA32777.1 transcriptional regulator [Clostridium manihotivorum]
MDKLTDFFKMLSDETRVRILVLLYHKKLCVCQMCGIMEETQPKISKHLAKLRDMGFVKDERKEQFIYYYLNFNNKLFEEVLKNIIDNIEDYETIRNDLKRLDGAEEYLPTCKR